MGKLDVLNLPSVEIPSVKQTRYGHITYLLCFYIEILQTVQLSPARVWRAKEDERLIVSLVASQVFVAGSRPIN